MKKILLLTAFVLSAFIASAQEDCSQVSSGSISNGGFLGGNTNQLLAVDIPVFEGTTFAVSTIKLNLIGPSTYVDIIIRSDNSGVPGTIIDTYSNVDITSSTIVGNNFGFDFYQVTLDVASLNLVFDAPTGVSRYWMEVLSDADGWESDSSVEVGLAGAFANSNTTGVWTIGAGDYVYELIGQCEGDFPVLYCSASAGSCTFESITNVTFADLNHTSGCGAGYNDYTDMVATVTQGETVQLSVTVETDEDDYIFVFIDWNNDGLFDGANESYQIAGPVEISQAYTFDISVPEDAAVGQTRMRVFLAWDEPDTNACSSVDYGEVEDYTLNIQAAANLNDFFASNISIFPNPTADIFNLVSNTSTFENVKVTDLNGRTVKNINVNSLSSTEVNISDLTSGMYFVTVQTDNGSGSTKIIKK